MVFIVYKLEVRLLMKLICSSIQRGEIEPHCRMFFNSSHHRSFGGEKKLSCSWCINDNCTYYEACTIGHLSIYDINLCLMWSTYYEIN